MSRQRKPALKRVDQAVDFPLIARPGNATVGTYQHRRTCIDRQAAQAREVGRESGYGSFDGCVEQDAVAFGHLREQRRSALAHSCRAVADKVPDHVVLGAHVVPGGQAALHANDPDPNAAILRRVKSLERNYPIYDMPKLPSWHKAHVVLLGDAAHAVGPHAGQGASMAIEDALVLAACLQAERDRQRAFCRYESLRRERVEKVVRITRSNSSQKRWSGKLAIAIRDLLLPLVIPLGTRAARTLFRFRADLSPLARPS